MPLFEYFCLHCKKNFEVVLYRYKKTISCPSCQSKKTKKLISPFRVHQTEAERLKNFAPEQAKKPGFYKDPRNIGLSTLHRAKKMGIDLGDQFHAKLEKARSVKKIEDVENL